MTYDRVYGSEDKGVKQKYWNMAIGLQEVDNLKPSQYLINLAEKNVNGEIDNRSIEKLLYSYYESDTSTNEQVRERECDIVSNRIVELLNTSGVTFNYTELKSIHRYLFKDIYDFAGEFRTYNIVKKEPILNGESVIYGNFFAIEDTLDYDFSIEKKQNYSSMNIDKVINRISEFTSAIWQVHPFLEGNTRTTAVFIERYLNTIGFKVNNEMFEKNSVYFRNALVRANFADFSRGISSDNKFINMFFQNLLNDQTNIIDAEELICRECFDE